MARFVLVHGSFHGPWCWERFAQLLEAVGHQVTTVALPTAPEEADLAGYAAHVVEAIDSLPNP